MLNLLLTTIATICGFGFILGYYKYTKSCKKKPWLNQYIGSYIFWCKEIPNKKIRYYLLIQYVIFWMLFVILSGNYLYWLMLFSGPTVFYVGYKLKNKALLDNIHNGILQFSVWTGFIFVLVRALDFWYITLLSFIPLIIYATTKKNKNITEEIITFDVIYLWLAIFSTIIK